MKAATSCSRCKRRSIRLNVYLAERNDLIFTWRVKAKEMTSASKAHAATDVHYESEALWVLLIPAEELGLRIPASHVDGLASRDPILS